MKNSWKIVKSHVNSLPSPILYGKLQQVPICSWKLAFTCSLLYWEHLIPNDCLVIQHFYCKNLNYLTVLNYEICWSDTANAHLKWMKWNLSRAWDQAQTESVMCILSRLCGELKRHEPWLSSHRQYESGYSLSCEVPGDAHLCVLSFLSPNNWLSSCSSQ